MRNEILHHQEHVFLLVLFLCMQDVPIMCFLTYTIKNPLKRMKDLCFFPKCPMVLFGDGLVNILVFPHSLLTASNIIQTVYLQMNGRQLPRMTTLVPIYHPNSPIST